MLSEILFETSLQILTLASVVIFLLGIGMLIQPEKIEAMIAPLNRWISTDTAFQRINQPHWIERYFYRYHVPMGACITVGAIYSVYMFVIGIDGTSVLSAYQSLEQGWEALGLFEALFYLLLLLNCVAIIFGLVVIFRPSLLKKIESWSNNWVSTEELLKPLDNNFDSSNRWLPRHPRIFGLVVALGSLYILLNIGGHAIY